VLQRGAPAGAGQFSRASGPAAGGIKRYALRPLAATRPVAAAFVFFFLLPAPLQSWRTRPCQGGTHCVQWGGRWRPALTWPRRDYLALLEEEEKRRSNRQPLCGCQGPATAAFPPASGRARRGGSTRPATGARPHTARQSKTVRPTAERSDLRGVGGHAAPALPASPRQPRVRHACTAPVPPQAQGLRQWSASTEACLACPLACAGGQPAVAVLLVRATRPGLDAGALGHYSTNACTEGGTTAEDPWQERHSC
jgi:hypothetical protein